MQHVYFKSYEQIYHYYWRYLSTNYLFHNPDKYYLLHFDGGIPDYRLNGKPNPDKTFETTELSGLTRVDCIIFNSI